MAQIVNIPDEFARTVDYDSPLPYYAQVKEILRQQIVSGVWESGDQLPGELELCRVFGVSRAVIRQALNEMVQEGLVVRRKGKGTFIAGPKIVEGLMQKLTGFYQDMVERGLTPSTRVLKQEVIPAPARVAEYLELEPGTQVIQIHRLRFVEGEPFILDTTYLPYSLCPDVLQVDLSSQSLYAFLENRYGYILARGHRTLEAVAAREHEVSLLQIEEGAPLMLLDSVSYLEDGTPLEYFHALHRGDRSRFQVELIRVREQGGIAELLGEELVNLPSDAGYR